MFRQTKERINQDKAVKETLGICPYLDHGCGVKTSRNMARSHEKNQQKWVVHMKHTEGWLPMMLSNIYTNPSLRRLYGYRMMRLAAVNAPSSLGFPPQLCDTGM